MAEQPSIADHAIIGDLQTAALVASNGDVDWFCTPRFDSPSVFGNLLDRGAGSFRLGPYGINQPTARTYVPGTNVMATSQSEPGAAVDRQADRCGGRVGLDDTVD